LRRGKARVAVDEALAVADEQAVEDVATVMPSKPTHFRLPQWALDLLERKAEECHESKTQVVVEAFALMRDREMALLMEEAYRKMAGEAHTLAEGSLLAAAARVPEW
jgi:hypothetical protein